MRLLLVEDNPRLQGLLSEALNAAGFGGSIASRPSPSSSRRSRSRPTTSPSSISGFPTATAWSRSASCADGHALPILVVTARGSIDERVAGLDAGADDYLTKPFNNAEFLARVRALLRRPADVIGPLITVGNTSINTATLEVVCDGRAVDLRFSERRLLAVLMRRAGQLVPKSALELSLSEYGRDVSTNAIEALVSRARRALAHAGSDLAIETVRGIGYTIKGRTG